MQLAQHNPYAAKPLASSADSARHRVAYCVGGITFGLFSSVGLHLALEPALRDFKVDAGSCNIHIDVDWAAHLEWPACAPSFDSAGVWSSFPADGGHYFCFATTVFGPDPYKAAWFNQDFTSGRVALSRRHFHMDGPVYAMEYPLDELLMIHRLARGEGIEVHALGVVDVGGRGHLFLGHSGAGKSTTARLWETLPNARILSDDRIILRCEAGQIWMYGTPWHGDAGMSSPACAPLSRMYLLEHGGSNELIPLQRSRAAAEFLARSFVPYHSADGLQFTLAFVDRVAQQTPCSIFRFVPDFSAVEAICHAED
jgi:hypothetical protein